jgi:ABC-type glycerol-3-phosphate transport system substrate-binding protein
MVYKFSQESPDYYVEILDYSKNGSVSEQDALTQLNTEIISGKCPADMICFSNISPYPYIAKGLLVDMEELIDQDPSISPEDIAANKAFTNQGGLYFVGSSFSFSTAAGSYSNFGDRYGWTLQEYLDFEKAYPDKWIIYNITQDYFFLCEANRYMRSAIDWDSGTCDFDNDDFVELLEASHRIMNKPESDDNLLYAYSDAVYKGDLIVDFISVHTFYDLARAQRYSSCKLSYVGWPTVDGSCGSDISVTCPVGIISNGNNSNGSWEFVKYMIMNGGGKYSFSTYMPKLRAEYEEAKLDEDAEFKLTDEDESLFFDLLDAIENLNIYDKPAQNIILNESADFFNGRKTAQEVAQIIQSKVSLYIAEQS